MLARKTLFTALVLLGAVVIGTGLVLAQNLGGGPAPGSTPAQLHNQAPVSEPPASALLQDTGSIAQPPVRALLQVREPILETPDKAQLQNKKPILEPPAGALLQDREPILEPPAPALLQDREPIVEAPIAGQPQERTRKDPNQVLADVGAAFPGFGGYYRERPDNTIAFVYMLDTSQQQEARQALEMLMGERFDRKIREVRVVQGQYGMTELSQWYQPVRMLAVDGIRWGDLDEGKNRIRIGVWDQAASGRVEAELAQLGIPRGAVVIEINDTPLVLQTNELGDQFDTLVGGIRIQSSTAAFAHCTPRMAGLHWATFFQPGGTRNIGEDLTIDFADD